MADNYRLKMMRKESTAMPSGKDKTMLRIVMTVMLMMGMVMGIALPQSVQAANEMVTTEYKDPPVSPDSPEQSQSDPYLYDLRTSMQVSYWGAVVDSIGQKFTTFGDLSNLDSTQKIWDFIEDKKIKIAEEEAKILCLFMEEDDPEPGDIIPDMPEWPECGNVLNVMFGEGAAEYIADADDNSKLVFQHLLDSMGIPAKDIEPTIEAIAGVGPDDLEFDDDETGDARNCYTPGNNIRTYETSGCGVLCTVTRIIMGLLNTASEGLVEATANNAKFQSAVLAVLTLYVTIYGAMVVLGLVQVALGDAIVRIIKLSVVAMLLTSETVMTLFHMARCFFIEGTTYLINAVMQVGLEAVTELNAGEEIAFGTQYEAMGNANLCGSSFDDAKSAQGPLVILEALLTQVFSAHMFLTLITLFLSKIYGVILAIFLVWGLFGFVMSLMGAVTIYLSALIGQYLLLSLLPFFVVFLLFERTSHLFQGWLNQLINYSLTPIFLFAYISLFVVVTSAALAQILDVKICWAKWFTVAWVFDISKWQFFDWDTHQPMPDLPFGFFEVLIFVLLVFLMREFENSVEQLAKDISNSFVYVNKAARELQNWFRGKANKIKSAPVQAAKNIGKKSSSFARGAVEGHSTKSSSGQKGTGGIGGGKKAAATRAMTKGGRK